ncbi:MAG: hypothetical protein JO037_25900 [Actinobacteria bacterium]|nr:hypothetical protein [Actinomycetota bacterium]
MNYHVMVKKAEQRAISNAGLTAVGLMGDVVHLAGRGRLLATAREPAVLVAQDHRGPDTGRDVPADADIQRHARAAQPAAELPAAQERGQAARPGQQLDRLGHDCLHQRIAPLDGRGHGGGAVQDAGPGHVRGRSRSAGGSRRVFQPGQLDAKAYQPVQRRVIHFARDHRGGARIAGRRLGGVSVEPRTAIAAADGRGGPVGGPSGADPGGPFVQ